MAAASIHRVYNAAKPRFQLRQGEEGLSAFDATNVTPAQILPSFRPGSLVTTHEISTIESFGLRVVRTAGDSTLPRLLQENHMEIRPAEDMTRKQFKAALRRLEQAMGGSS